MLKYKVALSFAGEDRDFVRQIATILRMNGISVFYDEYMQADIWGQEQIEFLQNIYQHESEYVMIFTSKAYLEKFWTTHEKRSALNASIQGRDGMILPVKLDDTKIPGIHESIGYLDGIKLTATEICDVFLKKIGVENNSFSPVIQSFRIVRDKYKQDMTGEGAKRFGGRWNQVGTAMLYTASNRALATLQTLIHLSQQQQTDDYVLVQYTIPGDVKVKVVYESDLPTNWQNMYQSGYTKDYGSIWVRSDVSCILSVPSAIIPSEREYLFNPWHKDFGKIAIKKVDTFSFDPRLR